MLDSTFQSGDTIKLQKHLFYFKFVSDSNLSCYDLNDSSKYLHEKKLIHKNFARYRKIKNYPLELSEIHNLILNKSWRQVLDSTNFETPNNDLAISRDWWFTKDSAFFETEYKYNENHILSESNAIPYRLFQVEGNVFLSLIGESDNPLPIYQVEKVKGNKIHLIDFNARYTKKIELTEKSNKSNSTQSSHKSVNFSKCFEGFQGEYYYGNDVTYIHGNDSIKNRLAKNFPSNEKVEGYVIVHFNINCRNQVGDFGIQQMDFDFQANQFSEQTITYLIREIKKLDDWPSTQSSYNWMHYKDVHAFLMFKIKNGQISDVSP